MHKALSIQTVRKCSARGRVLSDRHREFHLGLALLSLALILSSANATERKQPDLAEFDAAMELTPDIDNGRKLYRTCVTCHGPEGWGTNSGGYPQIAGQLPDVLIKQLADFRAGNRDNPIMSAFTSRRALGGPQDIADVAAYISQLPMTRNNGRGHPVNLEMGKQIYARDCSDCHGKHAEGDPKEHAPLLYGQHYQYLMRQFDWIRNGRRRNADEKMVKQIKGFSSREQSAVMSYISNLVPPEDKLAKPGWKNPDYSSFDRSWRPN